MGNVSNKIRTHIGEGELSEAIDTLNNYLKTIGGDLYNQAIHLKGSYKEYLKNRDLGLGDNRQEKSRISMAVLNLASEIEKQNVERTPTANDFQQQRPNPTSIQQQQRQQPITPQPQTPQYVAQCMFTMDTMQYFLAQNGQIFMVNPYTKQSALVGMKMPPQNPQFAWTLYFTTTNILLFGGSCRYYMGTEFWHACSVWDSEVFLISYRQDQQDLHDKLRRTQITHINLMTIQTAL